MSIINNSSSSSRANVAAIAEEVSDRMGSTKTSVGGFEKRTTSKASDHIQITAYSLVAFKKFVKDVMCHHSMNDKSIDATLNYFLEGYLVTGSSDANFLVPEPFRDDVIKYAKKYYASVNFNDEEADIVCQVWLTKQKKLDAIIGKRESNKSKNRSSSSNETDVIETSQNGSYDISSGSNRGAKNPFDMLNTLQAGELGAIAEKQDKFEPQLFVLANKIKDHFKMVSDALIENTKIMWNSSKSQNSICEVGLATLKNLTTAQIMAEATPLEKALNIAPLVRVFAKVMTEAFVDKSNHGESEIMQGYYSFIVGSCKQIEASIAKFIQIVGMVSLTPIGKHLTEAHHIQQFISGMTRSNAGAVKALGVELTHTDQHRTSITELTNYVRTKLTSLVSDSHFDGRAGKGKGGKGAGKGKGGKGKGKGVGKGGKAGKGQKLNNNNRWNYQNNQQQRGNGNDNKRPAEDDDNDVNALIALPSNNNNGKGGKGKGKGTQNKKLKSNENVQCHSCRGWGHYKSQCPNEKAQANFASEDYGFQS